MTTTAFRTIARVVGRLHVHQSTRTSRPSLVLTTSFDRRLDLTGRHKSNPLSANMSQRSMVMVTKQKAGESATPVAVVSSPVETNQGVTAPASADGDQHPLTITDSCWRRINKLTKSKEDDSLFLRVFVDAGGCSGFQYQFELDANLEDDDIVFTAPSQQDSARVVVDQNSFEFIRGSTIDYVQEMIKSSFEVRENPQSESACGCGSSFALKNFSSNPALD